MARLSEKLARHAQAPGAAADLELAARRDVLTEIPLEQIRPDPDQPRKDLGDLSELAESIRQMGVVQPIIVTVEGFERYRILAGERRYSAAGRAGLVRIPAIVRTVEEHERLQLQIIENLHRKDLNPFEEARAYQALSDQFGLTQEAIARRLGRSQETVSETLRLLSLPEPVQSEFATADPALRERLTRSLLLEIARQPEQERSALWEQARRGELTVQKARAQRRARRLKENPMERRHEIALEGVRVVVHFERGPYRTSDIVEALERALAAARSKKAAI